MFRLIFCACLLIVLAKTNPVLPNCPEPHCGQSTYRNSLADFADIFIPTSLSSPNQITQYERNDEKDQIYKLLVFHDRVANNPSAVDVIKNIHRYNKEDISNFVRNSGNIPNIVNNYIFLPNDVKTDTVLKPNKDNLVSCNKSKTQCYNNKKNSSIQIIRTSHNNIDNLNKYDGETQAVENSQNIIKKGHVLENTPERSINNKDSSRKTLKRSLEENNKTKHSQKFNSNLNQNENLSNSSNSDIHSNKTINLKKKSTTNKELKNKSKQSSVILNEIIDKTNNKKPNKNVNSTHKKHDSNQNYSSNVKNTVKKIQNSESDQIKRTKEENHIQSTDKQISKKKASRKDKNVQAGSPSVRNDFNDMYKYIDALLSNYQLTNTNFNSGFPFDYNNFYQLSQPYTPWNNINTLSDKIVPHKRRKVQRLRGKRLNKKRSKLKKKQKERKEDDQTQHIDSNNKLSKGITISRKKEESVPLLEKKLKSTNMISLKELENNTAKVFEESKINNNRFTEGSSQYNSHPLFIIGIEDNVPIIFEEDFIDDYYPDFRADNKALHMTLEDKMLNNDKYHYVSNHNFDLEDYIKKRKELAMHNKNTNIKLLFSEKATNEDVKISDEDVIDNEEVGRMIKFQSPPLLDNPDFRTRKIESHDKYEPYYYHNVFQNPDEDFNKYCSEKKEIVYPTSYSLKDSEKNKLCNEIDDSVSKAKWKKVKDSNVETVYARSKLAKYGLVL